MQCGCPECGSFMGQVERGLDSKCVCPACGYSCSACMGTNSVMERGSYALPQNFASGIAQTEYDFDARVREAMDRALYYLGMSAKTQSQMEQYLKKKGYNTGEIAAVIEKLASYGYIDDAAYARSFVESAANGKGLGRRAVAQKLRQRGIEREVADEALMDMADDAELANAVKWARKINAGLNGEDVRKRHDKLVRRLISKGFSYGVINDALKAVELDEPEDWDSV